MKHLLFIALVLLGCSSKNQTQEKDATENKKIRLIIDTDANNELDDQHALAYAIFNQDVFDIEGISVNNTKYGDGIEGHFQEALRILKLCNEDKNIPLYKGAAGLYSEIEPHLSDSVYDGKSAVDFIIRHARLADNRQLVLLPVGKLTNIALALKKAPEIKDKIRVVWLGSNYPDAGEYNLENDTTSVNPVIRSGVPFEMVVVRYGKPSGTGAVTITREEINAKMPGKGVQANEPITGRHGGEFKTFGDYSISLFEEIELHGNPPSRALFDMAAVAILKNPSWAQKVKIAAPQLQGYAWKEATLPGQEIWIWENFNRDAIIEDLFKALEKKNR